MDGFEFIKSATQTIYNEALTIDLTPHVPRSQHDAQDVLDRKRRFVTRPRHFSHYVMNLPASAVTFLRTFVGIHHDFESHFAPGKGINLPLIHVYCFSRLAKEEDAKREISAKIGQEIGYEMAAANTPDEFEGAVSIHDVRDVSTNKRMYCASFRLPAKVAFRKPEQVDS